MAKKKNKNGNPDFEATNKISENSEAEQVDVDAKDVSEDISKNTEIVKSSADHESETQDIVEEAAEEIIDISSNSEPTEKSLKSNSEDLKTETKEAPKAEESTKEKTKPETEADVDAKAKTEAETKSDRLVAITEVDAEAKVNTESETKADNENKPHPEVQANSETQTEKELSKKELRERKKVYDSVFPTSSFVKAFLLMLIPGVNILCVLFWSLGASKNRNKVHFSRACIALFLIEVLITIFLAGAAYIYLDQREAYILNRLDKYTNGLLTYYDIDTYRELFVLRNIPKDLVDKNAETEEPEAEEVEIPDTRVIENPEEIKSYEEFLSLYDAAYNKAANEQPADVQTPEEQPQADDAQPGQAANETAKAPSLSDILTAHNVDITKPGPVYIIIYNENSNCIIAFDPTEKFETIPSIRVDDEIIYIGSRVSK